MDAPKNGRRWRDKDPPGPDRGGRVPGELFVVAVVAGAGLAPLARAHNKSRPWAPAATSTLSPAPPGLFPVSASLPPRVPSGVVI